MSGCTYILNDMFAKLKGYVTLEGETKANVKTDTNVDTNTDANVDTNTDNNVDADTNIDTNTDTNVDNTDDHEKQVSRKSQIVAVSVWFFSVVIHVLSIVSVQFLDGAVPHNELNVWRFGTTFVFAIVPTIAQKQSIQLGRTHWIWLVLLCGATIIYNTAFYTATLYVAGGSAVAILNNITAITIAILSMCIKSERKLSSYIAVVFSIVGTSLIVQPEFLIGWDSTPVATNWTSPCSDTKSDIVENAQWIGYGLVVIAGVAMATCFLTIRKLLHVISAFPLVAWEALVSGIISLMLMGILETPTMPTSGFCLACLFIHCIALSQFAVVANFALQYLSAGVINLVAMIYIPLLSILQYTLMHDVIPPKDNWIEVLGVVVSIAGILIAPLDICCSRPSSKEETSFIEMDVHTPQKDEH